MITKRIKHAITAGACATVVATAIGFIAHEAAPHAAAAPNPAGPVSAAPAAAGLPPSADIADVAERVVDSVVNVSTTQTIDVSDGPAFMDPFFTDPMSPFDGQPDQRKAQSLGSGVIVSSDGKVLTNAHVVRNAD